MLWLGPASVNSRTSRVLPAPASPRTKTTTFYPTRPAPSGNDATSASRPRRAAPRAARDAARPAGRPGPGEIVTGGDPRGRFLADDVTRKGAQLGRRDETEVVGEGSTEAVVGRCRRPPACPCGRARS